MEMNDIKSAIEAVIGEYEPRLETYEVIDSQDNVHMLFRDAPDWSWFGALGALLLTMFCFFKCLGGMLKCKI